jgi:hypothetical protein
MSLDSVTGPASQGVQCGPSNTHHQLVISWRGCFSACEVFDPTLLTLKGDDTVRAINCRVESQPPLLLFRPNIVLLVRHHRHREHSGSQAFVTLAVPCLTAAWRAVSGACKVCAEDPSQRGHRQSTGGAIAGPGPPFLGLGRAAKDSLCDKEEQYQPKEARIIEHVRRPKLNR